MAKRSVPLDRVRLYMSLKYIELEPFLVYLVARLTVDVFAFALGVRGGRRRPYRELPSW